MIDLLLVRKDFPSAKRLQGIGVGRQGGTHDEVGKNSP